MRRTLLLCVMFLAGNVGYADGGSSARFPKFTSSPVPIRAANVRWKASVPLGRGIKSWAMGRHPEALRWFEVAVHRVPGDPIAWHNLGVAYFSASRFDEAMVAFRWERFLTPAAPSAWYGIGMCSRASGQLVDAENAFIVAVNQAPREWEYWHRLGEVLTAEGKIHPARSAFSQSARLKQRDGWVRRSRYPLHVSIMDVRIPTIPRIQTTTRM